MDRIDPAKLVTRAWSTLELKRVDEEQGILEGIASTPTTDRMGDIVEPKGAQFKLPIKLLWMHKPDQPIGNVIAAKVTDAGIAIKARIERGVAPYIDQAWALIKAGLVQGLSIGFKSIESADIDGTFGIRFIKWEWLELSAVTIPANADASIQTIKSIDQQQMHAALGTSASAASALVSPPGASGKSVVALRKETKVAKTTAELIADFSTRRAANAGRMQAIMDKATEDGSTLDESQQEEYDTLTQEIKSIDNHLQRLHTLEDVQVRSAVVIDNSVIDTARAGSAARAGSTLSISGNAQAITVRNNLPKGTGLARYVQALAASKGVLVQALEMARATERWKDTPEVELALKAAMTVGTTTSTTWAGPLVVAQTMVSEFIELLRPMTILGKLTSLRRVPFNIRVAGQTSGSSVGWVGQGSPKPVSELAFNEISLGWAKAAGIVVISQELARFSDPSAEDVIRQDLIDTMAVFMDQQFIDPAVAAVANVSPASITNGLTPTVSTGSTIALITADVQTLFSGFINNDIGMAAPVWVMHPATALALSLKRTSQDIFAFPDLTLDGGTWFGIPVVTSRSVPKTTSGGSIIVLMDQREIFYADDGQVSFDVSQEASVQMNSTPSAGAQSLVSFWQNNLVGIRAERYMNWKRRRDTAVAYIDQVSY